MKHLLTLLFVSLVAGSISAETLGQGVSDVRGRRVIFNQTRLPDSILKAFFNEEASRIATQYRTNERDTAVTSTEELLSFPVPANYFDKEALILGKDPNSDKSMPAVLAYSPRRDVGKVQVPKPGERPGAYSIWRNTLRLDAPIRYGDTLTFSYYANPRAVVLTTDTLDIPEGYLVRLKDAVEARCEKRLSELIPSFPYQEIEQIKAELARLQQAVQGRPADEK